MFYTQTLGLIAVMTLAYLVGFQDGWEEHELDEPMYRLQ